MTEANKLPPYFINYMEERFKRLEDRFDSNIAEIKELLKGKDGLVEKVEKHEKWIESFRAKIAIIVAILGGIFGLVFALVKDIVLNILKVNK
jgi:phage-related minor tail protein